MTTGRINQVTILDGQTSPSPRGEGSVVARRTEAARVVRRKGVAPRERRPRPRVRLGREPASPAPGHPIAPTEFPKARSVQGHGCSPQGPAGPRHTHPKRRLPVAGHVPVEERLPVYRRAPDCVKDSGSHRPTTHRLHRRQPN